MTLPLAFDLVFFAAASLAAGSFIAMLAVRLPRGAAITGRSRCRACGAALEARDLVPVLSWLWLKGRCRQCGAAVGAFYPAVELAALAVGLWAWSASAGILVLASCIFGWTLLALALIDFEHFLLPDALTLPLAALGLAFAWLLAPATLADRSLGAFLGYALFVAVAWLYRAWRGRDGLGAGDAKLVAAIGAWVGASGLPDAVLGGALLALAAVFLVRWVRPAPHDAPVPFGPALAAAGWLVWLYGPFPG